MRVKGKVRALAVTTRALRWPASLAAMIAMNHRETLVPGLIYDRRVVHVVRAVRLRFGDEPRSQ
jgi:hypothetical protein